MKNCSFFSNTFVVELRSTQFSSRGFLINQIIVCVVTCLLIIPTILLNSFTILTISKSRHLKEKVCYYLILVQSAIDLIVGTITAPIFVAFITVSYIIAEFQCVLFALTYVVAYLPMGLSLITLCVLSFERYMGVLHPFVHRTKVTKKKLTYLICCAAVVIIVLLPGTFFLSAYVFHQKCFSIILFGVVFIIFVYTSIFRAARKRLRLKNKPGDSYENEQNSENLTGKKRLLQELKLARSCFALVCTFGFCYLPAVVVTYSLLVNDEYHIFIVWSWSITTRVLNSNLNSIIFFWSRPILRAEARKVLKKIRGDTSG